MYWKLTRFHSINFHRFASNETIVDIEEMNFFSSLSLNLPKKMNAHSDCFTKSIIFSR